MKTNAILKVTEIQEDTFRKQALELLFGHVDWPLDVVDYLQNLKEDTLLETCASVPVPDNVQPSFLPMLAWQGGTVVVNLFDRRVFDELAEAGRQTPHYHHFNFATRVINGGYTQWIFHNAGSLQKPDLSFAAQVQCKTGDGYFIPFDCYHHVFPPEHNTVTLMIRSIRQTGRDSGAKSVNKDRMLRLRDKLLEVLSVAPSLEQGEVHALKPQLAAE